jgi:hypothetical protein
MIHPSLSSSVDWSVRWAGFVRGRLGLKGNFTALVQLQSVSTEGARVWFDGSLILDVSSVASGSVISTHFYIAQKEDPLYEIILEFWHSSGSYNFSFSIFDPESFINEDLSFETWTPVCQNYSDGANVQYPYQPLVTYDQSVIWQPSTIWTVGLPVVFIVRALDSYGNLTNKYTGSPLFFSFISGLATSTDVADIINYRFPLQSRWVVCANEGQTCFFPGAQIVGYGSQGIPVAYKQANERILCDSDSFGALLRNKSADYQCYLSISPTVLSVSRYNSTSIGFTSPSERVNAFITFRKASAGLDLALYSSPECTPHSLVARTKSGLSLNCSDLKTLAAFQCIQLDGVIAILESGLYEFGVWTSDDVMLFLNSELVLRSSSTAKTQLYSMAKYFDAFETALFRASIIPSSATCTTTFVWKLSSPNF